MEEVADVHDFFSGKGGGRWWCLWYGGWWRRDGWLLV
jgi:hypothetical protein